MTKTFKELEQAGWHAKAANYDQWVAPITTQATERMLDAVQVTSGSQVLDVACGPGYGAGFAVKRGATVIGIDFAPNMVAEATRRFPAVEFREGDAENLSFENGTFDQVLCPFGLLHIADPDRAIAEAFRVLRPGGRYIFTVWDKPPQHEYFALVLSAVQAHGNMNVALPPAPPIFRFSDAEECQKVLTTVGFVDVTVETLPLTWRAQQTQDYLDLLYQSAVRTPMLLDYQEAVDREKIHQAILDGAEQFKQDDGYICNWPAVMAAGLKPGD
ncbi:MAG: methyltransferase domain-containing protein [Caldilineaceae bacterium]